MSLETDDHGSPTTTIPTLGSTDHSSGAFDTTTQTSTKTKDTFGEVQKDKFSTGPDNAPKPANPQRQIPDSIRDRMLKDDDALRPNTATEADFKAEDNPFAFSPGQLSKMLNPKGLDAYDALGGLPGLEKGLRSDRHAGLSLDEAKLDGSVTFDDALKPDPGTEADFQVDDNPFAFSPGELGKMFNPKSLGAFYALGGLRGLEKGLRSDRHTGLSLDESKLDGSVSFDNATAGHSPEKHHKPDEAPMKMSAKEHQSSVAWYDRLRIYNDNRLPAHNRRSYLQLLWVTYNDRILILLTIASVISLALGLYETFSPDPFGSRNGDGITTACTATSLVLSLVLSSFLQEHRQRRRTDSQGRRRDRDRLCRVIRSGALREIQACELMVGDVVLIDPGDIIPVDGVLIDGHNIKCDESSMTGESDTICKQSSDEVFDAIITNHSLKRMDPLLISGSRVLEGVGHMMCTATGAHSSWGKVLASVEEPPSCPDPASSTETSSPVYNKPEVVHAASFVISVLFTSIFQLTQFAPSQALADFWNLLKVEDITSNTLLIKFCLANFATSVAIIPWAMLRRAELERRLNIWEAWAAHQIDIVAEDKHASATQQVSQDSNTIPLRMASEQAFTRKDMRSDSHSRASFLAEQAALDSIIASEDFISAVAYATRPSTYMKPQGFSFLFQHRSRLPPWPEHAWKDNGRVGGTRSRPLNHSISGRSTLLSTRKTENFIEGSANGSRIQAFPDNGADRCSISPLLAAKLGLEMTPGTERTLRLPNGSHIQSPGMVELSWKFAEEPEEQKLKCWVVPGCVHDLILGSPFLRATQTLTKFAHRIKSKLVNPYGRLHVRFLGDTQQRLRGSLDGHETLAMADSGSDAMLISKAYAQRCGLHIDRDPAGSIHLEFVDGSTEWTNGIVRNVPWSVEGSIQYCNFYVLDSLCEDLILSNDYLTETNSFVNHANSYFDLSQPREVSQLCLIRLIGRFSSNLNLLELDYLKDLTSPDAFNDEKIQRELARRDQIRDGISALAMSEQETANRAETERQLAWENHREAHRQGWRAQLAGPLLYSTSSESGGSSGAPLAGQGFAAANQLEAGRPTSSRDGKQGKSKIGKMTVFKKLLRAKP